jgi:hypothetical protein
MVYVGGSSIDVSFIGSCLAMPTNTVTTSSACSQQLTCQASTHTISTSPATRAGKQPNDSTKLSVITQAAKHTKQQQTGGG